MPLLGSVHCVGRPEVDLADFDSLRQFVRSVAPDVVINAAAYTAVDQAESEPQLAMKINGEAPGILAEEVKRLRGLLIHYSTDFVYDGSGSAPWVESSPTAPLNTYGTAKLIGDRAIAAVGGAYLIFRTSWVYATRGRNFVRTILRLAESGKPLRIVDDQIGSPTWSRDIALATALVIAQLTSTKFERHLSPAAAELSGIYHMSSQGYVSWCGFAAAILKEWQCLSLRKRIVPELTPIATRAYPTPAQRPSNSRLSNEKLRATFGVALPDWHDSLHLVMEELSAESK